MDAPAPAPAPAPVTTPLIHHGYGSITPPGDGAPDRKPERHSPPPPPRPAPRATTVNRAQRIAVAVLSALHIARGVVLLALPALGLGLLPGLAPATSMVVGGLLGVRDVLLGGLLATAPGRSDRELRRALAVSLLSDAADTFALIFAAACWRRSPVAEIGAVATLAIVEHVTLWSMAAQHEGGGPGRPVAAAAAYQARLRADEDKNLRLDMWFADMRRSEEMRPCSPAKLPR